MRSAAISVEQESWGPAGTEQGLFMAASLLLGAGLFGKGLARICELLEGGDPGHQYKDFRVTPSATSSEKSLGL